MSYCRFSSDDFQSDIYCYASDNGFHILIAANRVVFTDPLPSVIEFTDENIEAYTERFNIVLEMVRKSQHKPIDLKYAGDDLLEPTAAKAVERLEQLKTIGYYIPQRAIDRLKDEAVLESKLA